MIKVEEEEEKLIESNTKFSFVMCDFFMVFLASYCFLLLL